MGIALHRAQKIRDFGGCDAALCQLSAHVDFKEAILHDAVFCRLPFYLPRELVAVEGVYELRPADEIFDLVGLKLSYEVPAHSLAVVLVELLHAVFAEDEIGSHAVELLHRLTGLSLDCGDESDIPSRLCHRFADFGQMFRRNHHFTALTVYSPFLKSNVNAFSTPSSTKSTRMMCFFTLSARTILPSKGRKVSSSSSRCASL